MKNIYSIVLTLFAFSSTFSQVGIASSNPDPSAVLDLDVSSLPANGKKGMLLPRISLLNNTDIVTIPNPAAGIVVYNLNDNGTGTNAVTKDTFYFWDGIKWMDLASMTNVKNELLPQVFSIVNTNAQNTTANISSPEGVVVIYQSSGIVLNSGNNITFNSGNNTFTVNKTGRYDISGSINYNPIAKVVSTPTDLEFMIQVSSNNGGSWTNITKSTSVWDSSTRGNSRTMIVSPMVVSLNQNDLIRCVVKSNYGVHGGGNADGSGNSQIYAGTGITYSRALRIQYLN